MASFELLALATALLSWQSISETSGLVKERQVCADQINNCDAYGKEVCQSYVAWSQQNCLAFCGNCQAGQPTLTPTNPTSSCKDTINNCAALGPNICTQYVEFSHINCQKTCNLCPNPSTAGSSTCQDKLSNCASYDSSVACTGAYIPWAKDNCPKFCNICAPESTGGTAGETHYSNVCVYDGKIYKEGDQWKVGCEKNCTCVDGKAGHYLCQAVCSTYDQVPAGCKMITSPGDCCAKPDCPLKSGCEYKGQVHGQDQQWTDDCNYVCNCKDAKSGYYECRSMCVQWNLLSSCTLEDPAPGKCCKVPKCPPNVIIHYPDGYVPM